MKTEIKKLEGQGRIKVLGARLAFPVLNTPEQFQGSGPFRFSATLLLDKEVRAAVEAAMLDVAVAKWAAKGKSTYEALKAANKLAFGDGVTKGDYDGFADKDFISAHAQASAPPTLLHKFIDPNTGKPQVLARDNAVIYAGCYVNAVISFWAQDNQFGKRINASVTGVQFADEGDAFSGVRPASADEFDAMEPADELA